MNTTIARELPASDAWGVLNDYEFVQQRTPMSGHPMCYTFCVELLDVLPATSHPVQELSLHCYKQSFFARWEQIGSDNSKLSREDWLMIETVQAACNKHSEASSFR